ncbi:MAG: transporter permease [Marmoricola sp.]|nr:transporter permease [Marmoricola sp.]
MSTTTTYGATLDVSQTPRVPQSRLVKVELRKMVDTRAGMWLIIIIGLVTVAAVVIFGLTANDDDKTMFNFMSFTGAPQGFILPVMAILLITQEWGQRTAMVTFALEPHRNKVLGAKVYAALTIGAAAMFVAFLFAAIATALFGPSGGFDGFGGLDATKFLLLQATGILQGLAFGLLFLNSATAIVLFFVLPTVFGILGATWDAFGRHAAWFDFGTAQGPLFDAGNLTGKEWAQLTTTSMYWIFIPLAIGAWRMLRSELK